MVGTLLSAVNQGANLASGRFDIATLVRVATNYLVPFMVASIGYLAPFRQRRERSFSVDGQQEPVVPALLQGHTRHGETPTRRQ